jgi:Asp-tRNA(Asn)/Glu-tRNA(Gln) amidotransferase A subunit family amidase
MTRVAEARTRIAARNRELNAVLRVLDEPDLDPTAQSGGLLAGVPYVLKDTWDTKGIVTTGGSWRHRARVPRESCHAHEALRAAGAVLLGKSNLCDLAFSAESDNHLLGPVKNPHDLARTAGGSTGGGAAAVADGMAVFDWGTDFGGSIRGPAAFCGVVGLRLSSEAWPVKHHHFPRIAPFFWDICGMGPLTRDVATARLVVDAVRGSLRHANAKTPAIDPTRVVIYPPDRAPAAEWPSFVDDARRRLDRAGVEYELTTELPSPTQVNALYTEYLASHFAEFIATEELPMRDGIPAVLLALISRGRLDKRVHPNTAVLLAGCFALGLRHRDRSRSAAALRDLRAATNRIWDRGVLIVSPTVTERPPRHGRAAWAYRLMTFCKLGNLTDATGLAVPTDPFPGSTLPRSFQILGPPGAESAVLDLGERIERAHS